MAIPEPVFEPHDEWPEDRGVIVRTVQLCENFDNKEREAGTNRTNEG
jgi:hypothetical protein